jgi:hypothetical protein
MFIIPFYKSLETPAINILWLFLIDKGNKVWKTDEQKPTMKFVIKEYLEPNGLVGKCTLIKDVLFVEVPTINFNEFYKYTDSLPEGVEEVWRPFFMTLGAGWEEEAEKHSLGEFGSVQRIWKMIHGLKTS